MEDGGQGSIRAALLAVVNEEAGVRGLMRGWVPAYLRIGPLFLGTNTRRCVFCLNYFLHLCACSFSMCRSTYSMHVGFTRVAYFDRTVTRLYFWP